MTARPQNRCHRCKYTWYPRGKDLSLRCPACASHDVDFVPFDPTALYVMLGMAAFVCLVPLACVFGFLVVVVAG